MEKHSRELPDEAHGCQKCKAVNQRWEGVSILLTSGLILFFFVYVLLEQWSERKWIKSLRESDTVMMCQSDLPGKLESKTQTRTRTKPDCFPQDINSKFCKNLCTVHSFEKVIPIPWKRSSGADPNPQHSAQMCCDIMKVGRLPSAHVIFNLWRRLSLTRSPKPAGFEVSTRRQLAYEEALFSSYGDS